MIELYLPWPPSVNNYYAHTRSGVRLKKAAKLYRERVSEEVHQNGVSINLICRLSIQVYLMPPDNRVRDIDNLMKGLLDSLQHANVYKSDCQIDELHIIRGGVKEDGGVLVMIKRMDGEEISFDENASDTFTWM